MRQRLGQNFLIDTGVAEEIVAGADLSSRDTVVEIGPGRGILTRLILPRVRRLIAVELDEALAERLARELGGNAGLELVRADFLNLAASSLPEEYKIIANLPYCAATAILESFLPRQQWTTAVIMIQKEVAQRITAGTNSRDYGSFSLICQYYAEVWTLMDVGPNAFKPAPKVDSSVLGLRNKYASAPDPVLFPFIRTIFQQRRKTIANAVLAAVSCPKETVIQLLNEATINPSLRPENLEITSYHTLTSAFKKYIIPIGHR